MTPAQLLLALAALPMALVLRLQSRAAAVRERPERGDVPGWVMITIMSAALVVAILAVAKPGLTGIVTEAIDSVKAAGTAGS